jgi:hypothetical protein
MRLWLRNIPEHCLIEVEESSEDLKSESKSEPIMLELVQNYQELQEYPGQLVDQTMPQDFPETTEGQEDIPDFSDVVGDEMECHEDVPVSSHEDGAFIEDHGYQITLELEEQNTRELSEDFGGLENNESCSLDVTTSKSTDKKGKIMKSEHLDFNFLGWSPIANIVFLIRNFGLAPVNLNFVFCFYI